MCDCTCDMLKVSCVNSSDCIDLMYQLDIYALLWIYRNEFSPNKAVTAFKEDATDEIKT